MMKKWSWYTFHFIDHPNKAILNMFITQISHFLFCFGLGFVTCPVSRTQNNSTTTCNFDFDFLSGDDLQIQIILQIMKCDLKIKKTNQFKCDCDFDLQYCDLFQGLGKAMGQDTRGLGSLDIWGNEGPSQIIYYKRAEYGVLRWRTGRSINTTKYDRILT